MRSYYSRTSYTGGRLDPWSRSGYGGYEVCTEVNSVKLFANLDRAPKLGDYVIPGARGHATSSSRLCSLLSPGSDSALKCTVTIPSYG